MEQGGGGARSQEARSAGRGAGPWTTFHPLGRRRTGAPRALGAGSGWAPSLTNPSQLQETLISEPQARNRESSGEVCCPGHAATQFQTGSELNRGWWDGDGGTGRRRE